MMEISHILTMPEEPDARRNTERLRLCDETLPERSITHDHQLQSGVCRGKWCKGPEQDVESLLLLDTAGGADYAVRIGKPECRAHFAAPIRVPPPHVRVNPVQHDCAP